MICSGLFASVLLLLELLTELNAKPQMSKTVTVASAGKNSEFGETSHTEKQQGFATVRYNPPESTVNYTSRERSQKYRKRWGYPFAEYTEQDIIFPDLFDLLYDDPPPRISGPPKCAKGKSFCENVDSYPYRHLKDALRKNPLYKDLFGKDEAPVEIKNRVGGDQARYFCSSTTQTIYPQIGKNKENKWKFIVNQKEEDGLVQGILVETCRKPNKPCDIVGELPLGYTTTCKQKYIYRRLLALDGSGSVYPDSFQIPTACCCSYTRSPEFLARFGAPVTPAVRRKN